MSSEGGTAFSGKVHRRRPGNQHDLLPLPCEVLDGERHRGIRNARDHVHAALVEPLPRDGAADISLAEMVGADDLDRPGPELGCHVGHGYLGSFDAVLAGDISVDAA